MTSEVGARRPWLSAPESMFDHAAASCEARIRQPASRVCGVCPEAELTRRLLSLVRPLEKQNEHIHIINVKAKSKGAKIFANVLFSLRPHPEPDGIHAYLGTAMLLTRLLAAPARRNDRPASDPG